MGGSCSLCSAHGFPCALVEPAVTNADGAFEILPLPAGDWTFRAESETSHVAGALHEVECHGSEDVRLGRADVDDVRIRFLGGICGGRVTPGLLLLSELRDRVNAKEGRGSLC